MVPTFLTNLALGVLTTMVATIMGLSAWLPGSQIIQGNLFFDSTNNLNPGIYVNTTQVLTLTGSSTTNNAIVYDSTNAQAACTKYGSRFIRCYQQKVFTSGTGACVSAGCTGSAKSYHVASITKPYTGSGVIRRVEVTCKGQPKTTTIYASQVSTASTISGTNIFGVKTIGTGSVVVTSTGGAVWGKLTPDIRVFAGSNVGTSQCLLSVESDETYNP